MNNGDGKAMMTAFVKLLCSDTQASVAFYEKLGFTVDGRDNVFVHMKWGTAADLYLVTTPAQVKLEGRRGVGVLVGFTTVKDVTPSVDEVAQRAQAAGAQVDGPRDQPWHTHEVVVTDPDGYRLNFVEPN